jgi:predicted RNA-binding Zn-ribbon protein involved in translation (DUF1610 family)
MTREMTYATFKAEATERFGPDQLTWPFRCPNCGDVATARDFMAAGADPCRTGQECIGRTLRTLRQGDPRAERGCDWTAYGLIPGPWEIVFPAEGDVPGRTMRSFRLAEPAGDQR